MLNLFRESRVRDAWQVENAVTVFRRTLAAARDRSVVITAVGHTTNLLDLLLSDAEVILRTHRPTTLGPSPCAYVFPHAVSVGASS
jgi:hypothetical protein